jgi:hypothetical protein
MPRATFEALRPIPAELPGHHALLLGATAQLLRSDGDLSTQVLPGGHERAEALEPFADEIIAASMPAGSVLVDDLGRHIAARGNLLRMMQASVGMLDGSGQLSAWHSRNGGTPTRSACTAGSPSRQWRGRQPPHGQGPSLISARRCRSGHETAPHGALLRSRFTVPVIAVHQRQWDRVPPRFRFGVQTRRRSSHSCPGSAD